MHTPDTSINCSCNTTHYNKEPDISTKEPYISTKETYISTKETYISAKEPYISTKETYISAKEPYITSVDGDSSSQCLVATPHTKLPKRAFFAQFPISVCTCTIRPKKPRNGT